MFARFPFIFKIRELVLRATVWQEIVVPRSEAGNFADRRWCGVGEESWHGLSLARQGRHVKTTEQATPLPRGLDQRAGQAIPGTSDCKL